MRDDHIAMFQDHGVGLLLDSLDRDRGHGRTRRSLTDGLSIVAVILRTLDEGFDVLRRDQADAMPKLTKHAGPMMRTAACLQYDLGRRLFAEEVLELSSRRSTGLVASPAMADTAQTPDVTCVDLYATATQVNSLAKPYSSHTGNLAGAMRFGQRIAICSDCTVGWHYSRLGLRYDQYLDYHRRKCGG